MHTGSAPRAFPTGGVRVGALLFASGDLPRAARLANDLLTYSDRADVLAAIPEDAPEGYRDFLEELPDARGYLTADQAARRPTAYGAGDRFTADHSALRDLWDVMASGGIHGAADEYARALDAGEPQPPAAERLARDIAPALTGRPRSAAHAIDTTGLPPYVRDLLRRLIARLPDDCGPAVADNPAAVPPAHSIPSTGLGELLAGDALAALYERADHAPPPREAHELRPLSPRAPALRTCAA